MNYLKLLFLTGVLLLCVTPVLGWTVDSKDHSGTVEFYEGGIGHLNVDGYAVNFNWHQIGYTHDFEANYLWYSVILKLNDEGTIITFPQFPGARLVR